MWVEMAMDWDDKVWVYQNSPILKGDDMSAFENNVIGNISYLNKTLIICQNYH